MNILKTILFVGLFAFVNFAFLAAPNTEQTTANAAAIEALSQELCTAYNQGENLVLINAKGESIFNPNKTDLQKLAPKVFAQNRVRVTLAGRSDNNLCSTELVVMGNSGNIEGNYSVNACSSYGWIFFTDADCFDIALFHDAGLEAPYGNSVNGSVDWTFQFNNQTRISGTYMDMGAANMFKVASPCYQSKRESVMTADKAIRRMRDRHQPLGI